MSYLVCRPCEGRGLTAEHKECEVCDGNGILVLESQQVKAVEYRPERQVRSVSAETLAVWREDLEKEILKAEKQVTYLKGGLVQLDAEVDRRRMEREKKGAS